MPRCRTSPEVSSSMAVKHGTRSCYVRGCRQPGCVEANAVYERDRRWEKYQPRPRPTLREIPAVELAWLAGLLEGEGAFIVQRVPADAHQAARIRIRISLQMTDQDVVQKVRDVVGLGTVRLAKAQKAHHKDTHQWQVSAMKPVTDLMELLRPLMGERRQAQIGACLAAIEEAGESRSVAAGMGSPSTRSTAAGVTCASTRSRRSTPAGAAVRMWSSGCTAPCQGASAGSIPVIRSKPN